MIIKYWIDTGANIHSKKEGEIDLDELNMSEKEWEEATEDEKEALMKPIVFDGLDWGFYA